MGLLEVDVCRQLISKLDIRQKSVRSVQIRTVLILTLLDMGLVVRERQERENVYGFVFLSQMILETAGHMVSYFFVTSFIQCILLPTGLLTQETTAQMGKKRLVSDHNIR